MNAFIEDNWVTVCIDTLQPGWRGRVQLRAPKEEENGECEEFIGTVTEDMEADLDPDSDALIDGIFTFCTNYRDGRFLPVDSEQCVDLRVSQVTGLSGM